MRLWACLLVVALATLFLSPCLADDQVVLVSWNVESGGATPEAIGQIMANVPEVELWGLCEVQSTEWTDSFCKTLDPEPPYKFSTITGTSGGADRLAIIYNSEELRLVGWDEISWEDRDWWSPSLRPRDPLVAQFLHIPTGKDFYFMVNHLYSSSSGQEYIDRRKEQATALSEWAREQDLPVVAVGDYNFDWDLDPEEAQDNYNKGFGNMTAGSVFSWVVPRNLIRTYYWEEHPNANKILDFVFIANAAGTLTATSQIIVTSGDFLADQTTPDHRPVMATLKLLDADVSWKDPSLKQFKQAAKWGEDYEEPTTAFWIACQVGYVPETSTSSLTGCSDESASVVVWTPLCVTVHIAQLKTLTSEAEMEEEETISLLEEMHSEGVMPTVFIPAYKASLESEMELKELLTNELTLVLVFEGSIWDADTPYEATITQGDLVIRPFQSNPKYVSDLMLVQLESRFKIKDLDPKKPFYFSVSQQGEWGKRFTFKINPSSLGTGDFF